MEGEWEVMSDEVTATCAGVCLARSARACPVNEMEDRRKKCEIWTKCEGWKEWEVMTSALPAGVAVGHVIAGVVGSHKPMYDIWGDTVNVASRMDYTGEMGKIHVSWTHSQLYEILRKITKFLSIAKN